MLAFIIKLTYNNNRTIPRQLSRQSNRLLTDRSQVRVLLEEPILYGPLVKRLRHRPFTAVSRVRFPDGSPHGRLAQLGERLPYKQDVGSSILSSSTNVSGYLRITAFCYITQQLFIYINSYFYLYKNSYLFRKYQLQT